MFKYAVLALRQLRRQCWRVRRRTFSFPFSFFPSTVFPLFLFFPFPTPPPFFFPPFFFFPSPPPPFFFPSDHGKGLILVLLFLSNAGIQEAARCEVAVPDLFAAHLLPASVPCSQTSCWVIQRTENPCCWSITGYVRVLKVHPLAFKVFQVS